MKKRSLLVLLVLLVLVAASSAQAKGKGRLRFNEVDQLPQWTRELLITPGFECDTQYCGWDTFGSSEFQIECGAGMAATGNCNLRQGSIGGLDYAEQWFDLSPYPGQNIFVQVCYSRTWIIRPRFFLPTSSTFFYSIFYPFTPCIS